MTFSTFSDRNRHESRSKTGSGSVYSSCSSVYYLDEKNPLSSFPFSTTLFTTSALFKDIGTSKIRPIASVIILNFRGFEFQERKALSIKWL